MSRPDDLPVVLLVAGTRDATVLVRMLDGAGIDHVSAASIDDLAGRVSAGCGPIVTSTPAVRRDVAGFCEILDAQERWSDVPVILCARQRSPLPAFLSPLVNRSNTTLLRRPVQTATFVTVVRSALADRWRQFSVRDLLADLEHLNRRNRQRISQLQRLTFQLSRVEERERRRLAALLHDDLQQLLVGAQYRLNVIDRRTQAGREIADSIAELREQLTQAIDQTRSLSHELSPPPLRRQSLAEALRWLAGRMEHSHGLQVEVRGEIQANLSPEDLEILVYRAVQELLFNVVKHAGTRRAQVDLVREDHTLIVTVRDEGRGFDVQAKSLEHDSGTGLGLFGIRERAHVLGGDLRIESENGRGCTCTLTLPIQKDDEGVPDEVSGETGAATPGSVRADGRIRVLIVDDHRYLREGVKALLAEEPSVEVVGEASDGHEAIELVARERPDVVLLDVAMPNMDGIEAAGRLRRDHPQLRIIALSTFGHDDMGEQMVRAGADAYVCKSDPADELLGAVRGNF